MLHHLKSLDSGLRRNDKCDAADTKNRDAGGLKSQPEKTLGFGLRRNDKCEALDTKIVMPAHRKIIPAH